MKNKYWATFRALGGRVETIQFPDEESLGGLVEIMRPCGVECLAVGAVEQ